MYLDELLLSVSVEVETVTGAHAVANLETSRALKNLGAG